MKNPYNFETHPTSFKYFEAAVKAKIEIDSCPIKINTKPKFPIEEVAFFNPEGQCVGHINSWQLLDIRIQIAEQGLEGYSIGFQFEDKAEFVFIDKFGKLITERELSEIIFDQSETLNQCIKLRTLQLNNDPSEVL